MDGQTVERVSGFIKTLSTSEFSQFTTDLLEAGVIGEVVKDCLDNMDTDVSTDLRVQFLVIQMKDNIQNDDNLLDQLERILAEKFDFVVQPSEHESTDCSDVFNDSHISDLLEDMNEVVPHWKMFGVALGLLPYQLETIFKSINDLTERLYLVLQKSIDKGLTVSKLLRALRSKTVDKGKLANEIDKKYMGLGKRERKEDGKQCASKKPRRTTVEDVGIIKSSGPCVKVKAGKPLLLYVEATSKREGDLTYQWSCPGEQENYIGSSTPVLCIKQVSISMDGNVYKCCVHEGDAMNMAASKEITISVSCILDKYQARLKMLYRHSNFEENSVGISLKDVITATNIAIIDSQKIKHNKMLYTRETIRGDIDDVVESKNPIDYKAVFSNLQPSTRILMEGRPGCGKTTLVDRVCKDWGEGDIKIGTKLVIKIPLRRLSCNVGNLKLEDLFSLQNCSNQEIEEIVSFAHLNNGEGLCFILDGLDEISLYGDHKKLSVIYELFEKKVLPCSVVILTSRPSATVSLRSSASKHLEVIGFLKEDIFSYIKHFKFYRPGASDGLTQYLKQHPNVLHICYLPINTFIVAFLYNMDDDFSAVNTETEIYAQYLDALLDYNQKRIKSTGDEEMCEQTQTKYLSHIYKLAYDATMEGKVVVIDCLPQSHDTQDSSLGLVVEDKAFCPYKWKPCYTFAHLTFQEYFSACHFSRLPKEEQLSIVDEKKNEKHLSRMWKFYFGQNNAITEVMEAILRNSSDDLLFLIHCIYESKGKRHVHHKLTTARELCFEKNYINSRDFAGIAFVMSTFPNMQRLSFKSCTFSTEGVQAFFDELKKQLCLEEIKFHHMKCRGEDDLLNAIRLFMESMLSLKILDLSGTLLGKKHAEILFKNLQHNNLEVIKLTSITKDNVNTLLEGVRHWKKFVTFDLEDVPTNDIVDKFRAKSKLHLIAMSLIDGNNTLHLEDQRLKVNHLTEIFRSIIGSKKMEQCQSMYVGYSDIGKSETGFEEFNAEFSKLCNETMKELHLDHNHIKGIQLKYFRNALKKCSLLSVLDLNHNPLQYEGASVLSSLFPSLTQLTSLNLSNCSLKTEGIDCLSRTIHHLRELRCLHLRENGIGHEGARNLADKLGSCSKMEELNIGKNKIGNEGFIALLECFSRNCSRMRKFLVDNNDINDEKIRTKWKAIYHSINQGDGINRLQSLKQEPNSGSDFSENISPNKQSVDQVTAMDVGVALNRAGDYNKKEPMTGIENDNAITSSVVSSESYNCSTNVEDGGPLLLDNDVHALKKEDTVIVETTTMMEISEPSLAPPQTLSLERYSLDNSSTGQQAKYTKLEHGDSGFSELSTQSI